MKYLIFILLVSVSLRAEHSLASGTAKRVSLGMPLHRKDIIFVMPPPANLPNPFDPGLTATVNLGRMMAGKTLGWGPGLRFTRTYEVSLRNISSTNQCVQITATALPQLFGSFSGANGSPSTCKQDIILEMVPFSDSALVISSATQFDPTAGSNANIYFPSSANFLCLPPGDATLVAFNAVFQGRNNPTCANGTPAYGDWQLLSGYEFTVSVSDARGAIVGNIDMTLDSSVVFDASLGGFQGEPSSGAASLMRNTSYSVPINGGRPF